MKAYPLLHNVTEVTDRCRSCGCAPTRRLFKRRNYCGKCFYLFECLKAVERWDLSKPETLKNIGALRHSFRGGSFLALQKMSTQEFLVVKSSYISQIRASLDHLKARESKRRGEERVDGSCVEEKLKNILKMVQLRDTYERVANHFDGLASMVDNTLSPDQCRFLYRLLDDVEEHTYSHVAESAKTLEAIHQHRKSETVSGRETMPATAQRRAAELIHPAAAPNDLWLADVKHRIHFNTGRAYLLTVVDAYSGFVVSTAICPDSAFESLNGHLQSAFRRHGTPRRMIIGGGPRAAYTPLDVWILEHDIAVEHPSHRQTEARSTHDRFLARLRAELLDKQYPDRAAAEVALAQWAAQHNASRQTSGDDHGHPPADRRYCEQRVPFEYEPHDIVRRVQERGRVSLFGQIVRIPKAFRGKDVALRPTPQEGLFDVHFRAQRIATVKVRSTGRHAISADDVTSREAVTPIHHLLSVGGQAAARPSP
jgi:transposase InsO family protein